MIEKIYKKGNKWHYDLTSNGEVITVTGKTKEEVLEKMDELAFGDIPQIDFVKTIADFSLFSVLLVLDVVLIWANIILLHDYF